MTSAPSLKRSGLVLSYLTYNSEEPSFRIKLHSSWFVSEITIEPSFTRPPSLIRLFILLLLIH